MEKIFKVSWNEKFYDDWTKEHILNALKEYSPVEEKYLKVKEVDQPKQDTEQEYCKCGIEIRLEDLYCNKCGKRYKPIKPKRIEKIDLSIFNRVDTVITEAGLNNMLMEKINEIIDRLNEEGE